MATYIFEENKLSELIEASVQRAISGVSFSKPEPLQDRITLETVMEMTGKSKQWHYQKTTRNCPDPLPYQKFGRQLVFSRKAILEYINNHTKGIPYPDEVITARLQKAANKRLK